jgi:tRNA dimethylallyltransferase
LLVLLGPTGTGKSALAIDVARRIEGEIVGCDALQVYRGLDAATAKPPEADRREVAHHLLDCVDPRSDHTMVEYVQAADRAIREIDARGRVPVVVGGSGLYLRGLLRGYIEAPAGDPELRSRIRTIIERGGAERLQALLERQDPDSAERIPATDTQRLIRALELIHRGGTSWSKRLDAGGSWSRGPGRYPSLKIGLDMERERHRERLDGRVDAFFEAGLVAEVRRLLERGVPRTANAFKALGYREVLRAIEAGCDPEGVRDEVRRNTRRYAKRQRTWFRREPAVLWLDAELDRETLVERVVSGWLGSACYTPPRSRAEDAMDADSRNLQNDFFNAVRKERTTLTVFLGNGKRLTGRLKSFDKFTLLLENHQGEQMIFKHAISTVSACARPAEASVDEANRSRMANAVGHQSVQRDRD